MARPNFLIVMTDHQRADTVLREHPADTPTFTRFADEAVTFTNTFCPSPHCCPSRATFFTGLYPSRHGVWNNISNDQALSRGLREGVRTFGEDLRNAGYRLAFSGKWHVSVERSPADLGWEELHLSGAAGERHGGAWDRYEQIAAEDEPTERGEGQILRPGYPAMTLYGTSDEIRHRHDETAASSGVKAIERLAAGDDPWCLFVGLHAPHDPYFARQEYLDRNPLEKVELPVSYADSLSDKPRIYQRMRRMRFGQLSEREVREAVRHFWALCSYIDEKFAGLLDALERTGQAEDTVVLFCSDHGDYCGEHGLFAKGIPCFRGAYHVPAMVRWPAGVADPGRREEAFVSLADVAPTLLELAGIETGRRFTGRSLAPFFAGRKPSDWRDAVFTQCNGVELYYTQRSIMTATHKYVFNGFDEDELYDLTADPHEMVNLAAEPTMDPIKRELVRRMWRFARRENDAAINGYITVGLAPWGPAEAFRA